MEEAEEVGEMLMNMLWSAIFADADDLVVNRCSIVIAIDFARIAGLRHAASKRPG